jgi:hypothetical protein
MNWKLYNLTGTRSEVRNKVQHDERTPTPTRDYITHLIDGLPPSCGGVKIAAHGQDIENPGNLSVTRNVQITITGIGY